jgi:hypothetical protein
VSRNPFLHASFALPRGNMARAIPQIGTNRSNFEQAAPPASSHLRVMAARAADNATKETAMLKKLVMGAALAALLGTTALAQSYDPDEGGGNINPPVASLQGQQAPDNALPMRRSACTPRAPCATGRACRISWATRTRAGKTAEPNMEPRPTGRGSAFITQ